ncbi:MAG: hypothetical protein ACYCQI_12720 [Gammaproteobacteria bacterium]
MNDSLCRAAKGRKEISILDLIQQVKNFEFVNDCNLLQFRSLNEAINKEWLKVRNKLRKKIKDNKITEKLYAEYEAEEEMVVGLINLLNEKIINQALYHRS